MNISTPHRGTGGTLVRTPASDDNDSGIFDLELDYDCPPNAIPNGDRGFGSSSGIVASRNALQGSSKVATSPESPKRATSSSLLQTCAHVCTGTLQHTPSKVCGPISSAHAGSLGDLRLSAAQWAVQSQRSFGSCEFLVRTVPSEQSLVQAPPPEYVFDLE